MEASLSAAMKWMYDATSWCLTKYLNGSFIVVVDFFMVFDKIPQWKLHVFGDEFFLLHVTMVYAVVLMALLT
ncbi:hypothetical protein Leryth_012063 [Lithospermum erythrorhizon]|nr:hypothetical protein Leryth_012063 [Lithospermum erythrorhizon]